MYPNDLTHAPSKHGSRSRVNPNNSSAPLLSLEERNKSVEIKDSAARMKYQSTLLRQVLQNNAFSPLMSSESEDKAIYPNKRGKATPPKFDLTLSTVCQRIDNLGYVSLPKVLIDLGQICQNFLSISSDKNDAAKKLQFFVESMDTEELRGKLNMCCFVPRHGIQRPVPCHVLKCPYLITPGSSSNVYRASDSAVYHICPKCMKKPERNLIVGVRKCENSEEYTPISVRKQEIVKVDFPSEPQLEPTVQCTLCLQTHHRMCVKYGEINWTVGYSPNIDANFERNFNPGYVCQACRSTLAPNLMNQSTVLITAKDIINTRLAKYMTQQLTLHQYAFSQKAGPLPGELFVREVYSRHKIFEAKPKMAAVFKEHNKPTQFLYTQRSLMVYQKKNQTDEVAVFNLIVDEYEDSKTVHIAYLDSVRLYEPAEHRSIMYRLILIGYLLYLQQCRPGTFCRMAIWVCPPDLGDEYIFYGRPSEQIRLDVPELMGWYKKFCEMGMERGLISEYKELNSNIFGQFYNVPYMADDFFPDQLEKSLTAWEDDRAKYQAELKRELEASSSQYQHQTTQGGRKKASKNIKPVPKPPPQFQKVFEDLFNVNSGISILYIKLMDDPKIKTPVDLDPMDKQLSIYGQFMSNRDIFLTTSRRNGYDFSTIRRAVYSTFFMHERIMYDALHATCSKCNRSIERGVYCIHCQVNYCSFCSNTDLHKNSDMREFVMPYKKIKTSPEIFKIIMEFIFKEADFLATYSHVSNKLAEDERMSWIILTMNRHMQEINSNEIHDLVHCHVCLSMYPMFWRHQQFCKGMICNVLGCIATSKYKPPRAVLPPNPPPPPAKQQPNVGNLPGQSTGEQPTSAGVHVAGSGHHNTHVDFAVIKQEAGAAEDENQSRHLNPIPEQGLDIRIKQEAVDIPAIKQEVVDMPPIKQEVVDMPAIKQEPGSDPNSVQLNSTDSDRLLTVDEATSQLFNNATNDGENGNMERNNNLDNRPVIGNIFSTP